jgi:hypothetical protein
VLSVEPSRRPPSPRPLAELELDDLIEGAGELARRWAAALVLALPVERLGELPLGELALDGPRLCAQALRALQSDAELDRLTGAAGLAGRERTAPARRLAAIAGAGDPAAGVQAAECLRGVLWEALAEVPGAVWGREAAPVADRLAHVCAQAAAAALGEALPAPDQGSESAAGNSHTPPHTAIPAPDARVSRRGPVLVDEPRDAPAQVPPERPASRIQIRDARGDGAPPWIWAITRQLDRFVAEGEPFSVLLAELMDFELVDTEEPEGEVERLGEAVEQLVLDALRHPPGEPDRPPVRAHAHPAPDAGWLTRERPGRYWIVAAGRDLHDAQELADRLIHAAAAIRTSTGRSMALGVGTASCPQDGREPQALSAHAEVGLHAARAAFRAAAGISSGDVA